MACEKGGEPEVLASPAMTPQTSRYHPLCEVRLRVLACVGAPATEYVPLLGPSRPRPGRPAVSYSGTAARKRACLAP
jgi:hypothetical protein